MKKFRFGPETFQQKLRLLVILAPCLVLLLTVVAQVVVSGDVARDQEERLAKVGLDATVQELEDFYQHVAAITNAIAAHQAPFGRAADPKSLDFLRGLHKLENAREVGEGGVYGLYFAFEHKRGPEPGSILWVNREQNGTKDHLDYDHHDPKEKTDWYLGPAESGALYVTDPYEDPTDGTPMISVTRRVRDLNGQFIGVAGVDISLDALRDMVQRMQEQLRGNGRMLGGETVYLVSNDGRVFAHSELDDRGRPVAAAKGMGTSALDELPEGGDVGSRDNSVAPVATAQGRRYVAWKTAPGLGWKVVWSVPRRSVEAQIWTIAGRSAGLGALCLLVMVGVVLTTARRITGPVQRLREAAAAVEAGDYRPDGLGKLGDRHDEFGQLARGFRRMVEEVAARERQLVEAHDALGRSERHFRALTENASDIITVVDRDGIIRYKSPSVRSVLGHDPERLVGRRASDFIHPDDQPAVAEALRAIVERSDSAGRALECRFRHADGSWRILEGVGANLLDNPAVGGIVINSRDVTERRQAEDEVRRLNAELDHRVQVKTAELHERMEELAAAKEATDQAMKIQEIFMSNVAHDLRTPLAIVMGYSEDLLRRARKKNLAAIIPDLTLIVSKGRDLLELINDLLNLSRMMNDKAIELDVKEFDIAAAIAGRVEGVGVLAQRNGNTVEFLPAEGLGAMVADEVKLGRVLMNLVSNACKFTRNGRITIAAERVHDAAGDGIVFRVADTGLGMTPEQCAQLFHRFAQVHANSHKLQAGVGLGLSICQLYCEAMGGEIHVESEPGKGSTFTVNLPAIVSAAPAPVPVRRPRAGGPPPAPASRPESEAANMVLIIDDDASICELIARNLGDQGYQTRTASSGEDGLRLARQLLPSAIILDVVMPGIDGWAVLAALKTDAATADIPIIMATMLDEKERGYRLGADDYVSKPFSADSLTAILKRHLDAPAPIHLLVVEDDVDTRRRLAGSLREQGWTVAEAGDGREAIAHMERACPALVILDLMLPVMNGFEVIAEIRSRPAWQSVPIIVVTGVEIDAEGRHELQGEVERILRKGLYGRDELLNEIRAMIAKQFRTEASVGATTHA